MKGAKRLLAAAMVALMMTVVPTLAASANWEKAPTGASPTISEDVGATRGGASGGGVSNGVVHDIPSETQRVEDGNAMRGSGVGATGYGSAPGYPAATGPGNIPPFNAPSDATRGADMGTTGSGAAMSSPDMQDQSMQRGMTDSSMMQQGAVDSSMQRGSAAAGADSALRNEFRSSYQSGYTEGFTDGFSKNDQAHGTMGAQRGAMRDGMTGHPPISSSQHGWIQGYQDGFKDGFKAGIQ